MDAQKANPFHKSVGSKDTTNHISVEVVSFRVSDCYYRFFFVSLLSMQSAASGFLPFLEIQQRFPKTAFPGTTVL